MPSIRIVIGILLFIVTYTGAQAQGRWEPGYVILPGGDTLTGLIKDLSDIKNGRLVHYKQGKNEKQVVYTPSQLLSWYIYSTDKWYQSYAVPTDTGNGEKRFMQVIVKGEAGFYYLHDTTDGPRYFIKMPGEKMRELRQVKTEIPIGADATYSGSGTLYKNWTDKQYLGTLRRALAKCGKLVSDAKFDDLAFDLHPLGKKIIVYNRCMLPADTMYIATKLRNTSAMELMISAGIGINTVAVKADNDILTKPKGIIGYSVGIAANFFMPLANKSFSIQTGFDLNRKGASSDITKTTFNLPYLAISALLKYNYPFGPVRPFAGAGLLYGYSLNGNKSFYKEDKGARTYITGSSVNFEIAYCLEAGLKVVIKNSRVLLTARYERSIFPRNFGNSSLQFRLGYAWYIQTRSRI